MGTSKQRRDVYLDTYEIQKTYDSYTNVHSKILDIGHTLHAYEEQICIDP